MSWNNQGGYPPPSGYNQGYPPSSGYNPNYGGQTSRDPSWNGYPGQGGGGGSYPPPQGPPSGGWGPPQGPPPQNHWGPPQGPPPGWNQNQYQYQPPSGPPPPPPTGDQMYGPQFQGPGNGPQQPFFQYSQCNGRRKALCVGINYFGTSSELHGCINDVHNVKNFIMQRYNYRDDDIVVLTDDAQNPRQIPTRANIIEAMHWLVRDAQPNDALFFHYSGHGGQTKDLDGDEDDGNDEVIYPLDYENAGHIVDDEMHFIMVRPLPPGCRLTAIFDSCHSGTALDLPYVYSTEGKIKEPNLAAEAGQGLLSAVTSYARGDIGGVFSNLTGLAKLATGNAQKAEDYARQTRTSPADVIMWSGCKDSQTSADANEAGRATGAMSYAFIAALTQQPQQSYMQLLNNLRDILRAKYSQKPQLSSSHPMDTNILFIA